MLIEPALLRLSTVSWAPPEMSIEPTFVTLSALSSPPRPLICRVAGPLISNNCADRTSTGVVTMTVPVLISAEPPVGGLPELQFSVSPSQLPVPFQISNPGGIAYSSIYSINFARSRRSARAQSMGSLTVPALLGHPMPAQPCCDSPTHA